MCSMVGVLRDSGNFGSALGGADVGHLLLAFGAVRMTYWLWVAMGIGMTVTGCITPRGIHAECDARAMRVYAFSGTATLADRDTRREVYELSYQRCVASFGAQDPLRRMPE